MHQNSNKGQLVRDDVPQISEGIPVSVVGNPLLKMGWALKSSKEYRRLSEKQKTYLLDTYHVGEQTGQKADPVSVSKTIKKDSPMVNLCSQLPNIIIIIIIIINFI